MAARAPATGNHHGIRRTSRRPALARAYRSAPHLAGAGRYFVGLLVGRALVGQLSPLRGTEGWDGLADHVRVDEGSRKAARSAAAIDCFGSHPVRAFALGSQRT